MEFFKKCGWTFVQSTKGAFVAAIQALMVYLHLGTPSLHAQNPSLEFLGAEGNMDRYAVHFDSPQIDAMDFTILMAEVFSENAPVDVDWSCGWFHEGTTIDDLITLDSVGKKVRIRAERVSGTSISGGGLFFEILLPKAGGLGIINNLDI